MLILPETVHKNKLVESPDPPSRWPNSCRIVCKGIAMGQIFGTLLFTWNQLGFMDAPMFIPPSYIQLRYFIAKLTPQRLTPHKFTRSHWGPPACSHPKYPRSSTKWSRGWYLEGQIARPLIANLLGIRAKQCFRLSTSASGFRQIQCHQNLYPCSTPQIINSVPKKGENNIKQWIPTKPTILPHINSLIAVPTLCCYRHRLYQGAMAMRQGPRCVPRCFEPLSGNPTW